MGQDFAIPRGADSTQLTRLLDAAHDRFLTTGEADDGVRSLVLESWRRSLREGVDPERTSAAVGISDDALADLRAAHPLTAVMPVIRRLLVDSAAEAGLVVAVSDAAGRLLYVEGASALRSRAEAMAFVAGADWSEASAGTNAPGTALALGRPVQILGPEHLSRRVTPWSCSASPIRDPDTGAMLGVLDVTGGVEVATPHALHLVRATAAAAEAELRISRLTGVGAAAGPSRPQLQVLGRHGAVLSHGPTTTRLSMRHSEMLLLLAESAEGLSGAELAVGLTERDQAGVTMRAEVSRLRHLLGPVELASRPYRLPRGLSTDLDEVRQAVRSGRMRQAVASYRGPVLPRSESPAVVQIREDLHARLRSAVLASRDPDAILSLADTEFGREDYAVWACALDSLPADSPRLGHVERHLRELDARLG
ncbi:transcriptional regulator [Marmoricola endophyticus]|uniref:Transcriptional regulator n=1 Tax=Marmoricola endophyticus TaxID=2040280 RepID=A0A917BDL9_9ACTN|nr:GAF domain-containing protein [Marmoricola endophyticus]GGF34752.1 transcriptional regulator [Marmoricola endophyticus]